MNSIRTNNFVDWEEFLNQENSTITLLLDFEIDAGFSFITAIAQRAIKKGATSITIDHNLKIPDAVLNLDYRLEKEKIKVTNIKISALFSPSYELTDQYSISAQLTTLKIDYNNIKSEISKRAELNPEIPRKSHASAYLSGFFGELADALSKRIVSHIELSGFFAKISPSSINLYLLSKNITYRILQQGGGHHSSGQHPIHPKTIKATEILKNEAFFTSMPNNFKKHYQKGIHYNFLGFYDESFLSYYKLIETIFRSSKFIEIVSSEVFKINNKNIKDAIKNSNQKIMMLFIYQALIQNNTDITGSEKENFMQKMLESSQLRNDIAHSSDQTNTSRKLIEFINLLSRIMLERVNR
ncbi:hypothetical protein [Pseudomonas helleri]|uniref:hypothetical protein n=1 Tax=Pseudomonas helleri TaxID=1608996 RepID=UPI003D140573